MNRNIVTLNRNVVTFLAKGSNLTLLTQVGETIGKHDPRQETPFIKDFPSNDAAAAALDFAISTSQLHGWHVGWRGRQLNDPKTS